MKQPKPQLPVLSINKRRTSHKLIERLLAEHSHALQRFIRVRLAPMSMSEVEDVLQDVYVRLSQIDDLPQRMAGQLDTARNYLFQIASNLLIDRARRAEVRRYAQHVSVDDHNSGTQELTSELFSPERQLANKRKLQRLEMALAQLKRKHRKAFLLNRVDGMSYREVSEQMGISVSTVEKHIAAALGHVRRALQQEEDGE